MILTTKNGNSWQLDKQPCVMGVLNVTPDSFSDGGRYLSMPNMPTVPNSGAHSSINIESAFNAARVMLAEGAAIIDVGGESTRPGAQPVSEQEELQRVIPLVEKIAGELDCIVSVDTSSAQVMREAAHAGAGLLNDVRGFSRDGATEAAVASGLPLCIMHMAGEPGDMQDRPHYRDVVAEVKAFLSKRVAALCDAGASRNSLIVDPGFGFGKLLRHNLQLLASLGQLHELECKILVGMSRKSMLGEVLQKPVDQRLYGGLALASIAVMHGAHIVRTHDVGPTVDVIKMAYAVRCSSAS